MVIPSKCTLQVTAELVRGPVQNDDGSETETAFSKFISSTRDKVSGIERLLRTAEFTDVCIPENTSGAFEIFTLACFFHDNQRHSYMKNKLNTTLRDHPRAKAPTLLMVHGKQGYVIKWDGDTNKFTIYVTDEGLIPDQSLSREVIRNFPSCNKMTVRAKLRPVTDIWVAGVRSDDALDEDAMEWLREAAAKSDGGPPQANILGRGSYEETCAHCGKSWF